MWILWTSKMPYVNWNQNMSDKHGGHSEVSLGDNGSLLLLADSQFPSSR